MSFIREWIATSGNQRIQLWVAYENCEDKGTLLVCVI